MLGVVPTERLVVLAWFHAKVVRSCWEQARLGGQQPNPPLQPTIFGARDRLLFGSLCGARQLNGKPLGRPIVWRNALPRPVAREVVDDLRREFGDCALRLVWDIGEGSSVFQVLVGQTVRAYVKLAKDLAAEAERLQWLERRIPAPRVVSIGTCESTDWLVTTPLAGLALSDLKHTEPPARITRQLAEAIHLVHNTPADDCPFGEPSPTSVLVHGDACLPNFLFASGTLTGIVDLGQCGLGDPRSDLATAVWSVQYNLGSGHAKGFLDAYGIDLEANNLELTLDEDGNETLRLVAGHTSA